MGKLLSISIWKVILKWENYYKSQSYSKCIFLELTNHQCLGIVLHQFLKGQQDTGLCRKNINQWLY
uniref:Uncharacterized protein n=1 Tax=Anguilla anguilla TaxID=7936 RepID=A0A0E9RNE1_ANGAN